MPMSQTGYVSKESSNSFSVSPLILLAFIVDLAVPFLIWKGIVPPFVRWVSHASIALMIIVAYTRMMSLNRIPGVVWLIGVSSAIGIFVAFLNGQGLIPTVWGWWIMFQFPIVGLFAYLQPRWPEHFAQLTRRLCVGILGLELMVQIGQYLAGEQPGDNLAGTFGKRATGNLEMFILLVLCLALGQWITSQRWKATFLVLIVGTMSSVLGEMKFFIVAGLLLILMAVAFRLLRSRKVLQIIPYLLILGVIVFTFIRLYNQIVPGAGKMPIERYLEDPAALANYLNFERKYVIDGKIYYDIGRNTALQMGWDSIGNDPKTLLWGMGLGARGESVTLDTEGTGLQQGLGLVTTTSLLVMLQELGLVGMIVMACLYVWLLATLYRDIGANPQSEAAELRYALLLFSLLWPLWLWYTTPWTFRVPMLLYWVALGYVLSEAKRNAPLRARASISLTAGRKLGNVTGRTFSVLKDTYTFPTITVITVGLYILLGRVLT